MPPFSTLAKLGVCIINKLNPLYIVSQWPTKTQNYSELGVRLYGKHARNLSGIPYISLVSQHFVIFFQHLGNLKINDAKKMPSNSVILHFTFSHRSKLHTCPHILLPANRYEGGGGSPHAGIKAFILARLVKNRSFQNQISYNLLQ